MDTGIHEISNLLNALPSEYVGDYKELQSLVSSLGESQKLISILHSILVDQNELVMIAARSYIHYNGFDKIVLFVSNDSKYKLRLHIWWPEQEGNITFFEENIHNHRWDFGSYVITGSINSEEFEISEDGIDMHQYRYNPRLQHDHYTMEFLGLTKLRCSHTGVMNAGSDYAVSHTVLHRISTDRSSVAATLMLQSPSYDQLDVRVYSEHPINTYQIIESPPMSVNILRSKLRSFLSLLESK